ncbi:MAG: prepilin-type N-terminal cleavage/methylation domain-containing protein [Lentisphaeria bacterium]|nr:prepilin-type N-terminal cleavage/methylation domain-containing protein [Lentisphaeria bacterium]
MKLCRNMTSRFTMIELMVVSAILAILASILIPVLTQAKAKAKRANWISMKHNMQLDSDCFGLWSFSGETVTQDENGYYFITNEANYPDAEAYDIGYDPKQLDMRTYGTGGIRVDNVEGRFRGDSSLYYEDSISGNYLVASDWSGAYMVDSFDRTITSWMKLGSSATGTKYFFGDGYCSSGWGGYALVTISGDIAYVRYYRFNSNGQYIYASTSGSEFNPKKDEWFHVALTISQPNHINIYINGELATQSQGNTFSSTDTARTCSDSNGYSSRIGVTNLPSYNHYTDIYFSSFALFNREMTAQEIKDIYRGSN